MGMADRFDDLKQKAQDLVGDNSEKAKEGVDKAAEKVDDATGSKYTDQVDKGAETAKDGIDRMDRQ